MKKPVAPARSRQGVVVSAANDKTIVVEIKERKPHPVYGKMMTSTKKFHAHDENNEAGLGDTVTIMETRPMSKDEALAPPRDRGKGQIAQALRN